MKVYGFTYNCDKCAIDNDRITSFIYAHGVLEDKCGYDIVYIPQYNSSLDFEEDILDYHIQKLTLQPIVENALYHGIKNKRGGGKITVTGKKDGDDIVATFDGGTQHVAGKVIV